MGERKGNESRGTANSATNRLILEREEEPEKQPFLVRQQPPEQGQEHADETTLTSVLLFSLLDPLLFFSLEILLSELLFFFLLSGLSPAEKPSPSGTENPCPTSVRYYVLTYINNCL